MRLSVAKMEAFASQDDEALVLMRCVYLDCESQRLLATDGRIAARVSVSVEADDVSGLLPQEVFDLARKELKLIRKAIGKEEIPDPWLRIACGEDAVIIENLLSHTNHIVNRPKLLDRQYPNIDSVFPGQLGNATFTLSRDLLTIILSAIDGESGVAVWAIGSDKPVVFAPTSGQAIALLMPMRGDLEAENVLSRGAVKTVPAGTL